MFGAYLEAIRVESSHISRLPSGGELGAPVPFCPGWTLRDLVLHLGTVQRFWAQNVQAADPRHQWSGHRVGPGSDVELARWSHESTLLLVSALEAAGHASPCWTWWDEPRTAGAVARHQVQEATVHRWDAQAATGEPDPIDATVADDGVSEFLEIMLGAGSAKVPGTVTLVASDTDREWKVGAGDSGRRATVKATASGLVLLLYRRVTTEQVAAVGGDAALVHTFLSAAGTT